MGYLETSWNIQKDRYFSKYDIENANVKRHPLSVSLLLIWYVFGYFDVNLNINLKLKKVQWDVLRFWVNHIQLTLDVSKSEVGQGEF